MTADRATLRECPHCGNDVRSEAVCCGFYADGRPAIPPDLFAKIAAMVEAPQAPAHSAVDFAAIAGRSPSRAADPSDVWDKRRPSHEGSGS